MRIDVQGTPVRRIIATGVEVKERRLLMRAYGASDTKKGITFPAHELVLDYILHNFPDSEVSEEALSWYKLEKDTNNIIEELSNEDIFRGLEFQAENIGFPSFYKLKPYQRHMVAFGLGRSRFINSDDRGLGKTLEAISVAELADTRRVLIVCPGYLKFGWQREIKMWAQKESYIPKGDRAQRTKLIEEYMQDTSQKYLIVNYEMLRPNKKAGGYPELLEFPWDMVICDEAHRLKGRQSQWVEGMKQLRNVPRVQFLTGNPIANRPEDIWQLLNLIDPIKYSGYWNFVEYFCDVVDTFFGKEIVGVQKSKMAQLQYCIQPFMLRRLKEDVAPELPAKIDRVIEIELEGVQKRQYKTMEKQMVYELKDGGYDIISTVVAVQVRLLQCIANPAIIDAKGDSVVERAVVDLVEDIFESEDKIIVGTMFVKAADFLQEKLVNRNKDWHVFRIKADMKSEYRDQIVQDFKSCSGKSVLIGTIRTMSEGLNIDECDTVIFADKSWTPMDNEQFADRIHRITSTRIKNYYHIVVKDTVSEDREEILADKIAARDEILSMQALHEKLIRRNS